MVCKQCGIRLIVAITAHLAEDGSGDLQCENCDTYNEVYVSLDPNDEPQSLEDLMNLDDEDLPF